MTTTTKTGPVIHKEAVKLAKQLNKAGLNTKPYTKAPVAVPIFTIGLDVSNTLRIWPGLANLTVYPDANWAQAVIVSDERRREITRSYVVQGKVSYPDDRKGPVYSQPSKQDILARFPIQVPGAKLKTFTAKELEPDRNNRDWRRRREGMFNITATITATGSTQAFLVGYDETQQFISALPRVVKSVERAHEILRPAGVPKDALRQGEWFFVPVTQRENTIIQQALQDGKIPYWQRLETGSTHTTLMMQLSVNGKRDNYATLQVIDSRNERHSPLILDGWYRVVRNREVVIPVTRNDTQVRRRTWD
ncbi:MAG TPA: hypothetical protein VJ742_12945 [Nitrososphaera sp.]|nr:hypothetical protein [Nitrososphaera sp.]